MTWGWQVGWISLYVGGVLAMAHWLAGQRTAAEHTRKFVHIAIGNIILPTWLLAVPLWLALTFGIAFSLVTLLSYRFNLLNSLGVDRRGWGTFFYALSITLLIAFYWPSGKQVAAVVGILVMTWGDALAALVGQRWGRIAYQVLGARKTLEGTATMVVVSFAVTFAVLCSRFGATPTAALAAFTVALVAAALETVSFGGLDNLTVPLGSAVLTDWFIGRFLG